MELWTEEQIAKTLLQKKVITEEQSNEALKAQRESGKKFTRILLDKNVAAAIKINSSLAGMGCSESQSTCPMRNSLKNSRKIKFANTT